MINKNFDPILKQGMWRLESRPMIASVAMEMGAAIYRVGDGTHTLVTNATANFEGIMAEAIASTDADYATSLKMKKVWVPLCPRAEAQFTVGAGTFTAADIGKSVKFNDSKSVAVDTAGTQFVMTKYQSSTKGEGFFNLAIS